MIDSTFQLYLASGQLVAPTCPAGNGDVETSTDQIHYTVLSEATFTFQTSALLLRCSGDTDQEVILFSSETGMYCNTNTMSCNMCILKAQCMHIQWNLYNADTWGPARSVLIIKVLCPDFPGLPIMSLDFGVYFNYSTQ